MQIFFVKFFLRGYEMEKFKSVDRLVNQLKPSNPVYCIRAGSLKKASSFFQHNFKGKILYAVKTNPNEFVLKTLFESGINNFDIASIKEIQRLMVEGGAQRNHERKGKCTNCSRRSKCPQSLA